jgi:hypothetical protein
MTREKRRRRPAAETGEGGEWRTLEYRRAYDGLIRRLDELVAAGFDTGERARLIMLGEKAAALAGNAPEALYDALTMLRDRGAVDGGNLDDIGGRLAVIPGTQQPQRLTGRVTKLALTVRFNLSRENASQLCDFLHTVTSTSEPHVTEEALDQLAIVVDRECFNSESFGRLLKLGTEAVRQGLNAHCILGVYNSLDHMLRNGVVTPDNAGAEGRKLYAVARAAMDHFKDNGEAAEDILSHVGSARPKGGKTMVDDIVAKAVRDINRGEYRKRF